MQGFATAQGQSNKEVGLNVCMSADVQVAPQCLNQDIIIAQAERASLTSTHLSGMNNFRDFADFHNVWYLLINIKQNDVKSG